ncbi:helix-turn-helix domain-containing protein [Candidatus Woesearchaeota archaeon]|nr:helix-turn-helix domain-containing protein [Candidatus Woesearchaeota archaeon]
MDLFKGIIEAKTLAILRLFLDSSDEYFHINLVSQKTKVPLATAFRIIKKLEQHDFIEHKIISKFKIYRLKPNKKTKILGRFIK